MNPVNWFEIPVVDLPRAKSFYESVFGLSLQLEEMGPFKMAFFPMGNETYGATGSLMKADTYVPSRMEPSSTSAWRVSRVPSGRSPRRAERSSPRRWPSASTVSSGISKIRKETASVCTR